MKTVNYQRIIEMMATIEWGELRQEQCTQGEAML